MGVGGWNLSADQLRELGWESGKHRGKGLMKLTNQVEIKLEHLSYILSGITTVCNIRV